MKIERIFDILHRYQEVYPDQTVAFGGKVGKEWVTYSPQDYIDKINKVSYALIHLGIEKGDKVGIIATNRPEWNILDMAIMQIGAITVPIYPTLTASDYLYILNHAEVTMVILEGAELMGKILSIREEAPRLQYLYTFIDRKELPYFDQLIEMGEEHPYEEELKQRKDSIQSSDCSTIIYTSGTTGTPKGVMLSHSNIVNQFLNLYQTPAPWSKTAFSFLPLCHAYERMLVFLYQYLGMSVYYAQNLGTIGDNIKEVKPTMMSAVPRMLDKIYDKIYTSGNNMPTISKMIFRWALKLATQYKIQDYERTWYYNMKHRIADRLVYAKIRNNIGGNFDIVVSGAASLQPRIASFFSAIGMPIYEGYGLTETSPVIAVSNRDRDGRASGTVGMPLPGIEVKIAENGEVCCRGHNVMMGYYKDEALTKSVIDQDGWFHTGDIGLINEKGQLILTGRLKSLFKTSFGKYINPQVIEDKVSESPFVEHIVVVGEGQKFAAALIKPDFDFLKQWCLRHDIEFVSEEEAVKDSQVIARYSREIDKYNQFFGDTEKIRKFELIPDEWSQHTDILTPTLKVKRKKVELQYQEVIQKLFQ
ncbi:MAG TPA: long-chain fatty acid--CoA ligase [Bacteroidales bacterium]|nr:long-chain fatty acid--CoA ligase [Bacteroidales bacterium]HOH22979.1 long-chain fatty acid--CoA ligase [Bacteroidales bacterium]HPB57672.1 long-chain fatty acid--CoA ligase [Bacteroidales bacterium]HPZ03642.1 long-chain fatty acid--CoA ligase [Bacteroidales bacterium]HQB75243.1 long-chain fatty acid--CoA ligase [Bacteroidales bacterium]